MSWMELPEEDQPPQQIWLDSEAVSEHFERVQAKYKSTADGTEAVEDPDNPLVSNELTASLRKR